jgi:acyl-CoA synthetase (AMP-forming)/AMP-acid ligase II
MDEIGQVFIDDRNKDMVSTAGFKVFPAEIERVVAALDAVAMVAVGSQRRPPRRPRPRRALQRACRRGRFSLPPARASRDTFKASGA